MIITISWLKEHLQTKANEAADALRGDADDKFSTALAAFQSLKGKANKNARKSFKAEFLKLDDGDSLKRILTSQ